jgi:AcrR family transcriptional regulator
MVQEQELDLGRRARNRLARHRSYLDTALHLATTEGLGAVTMQRLAAELDCAVGTVYTYFPSKGALVAEVQREAIDRLAASYLLLDAEIDARLKPAAPAEVATLTHVLGVARFFIDADITYPEETRLLQILMSATEAAMPDEDATRVLPSAMRLLGYAHDRLVAAVEAGALAAGDAMDRTVTLAAAVSGVLQVGRLARWDAELLDGHRLARAFVDDLMVGWGAELGALANADAHLVALGRRGPLARPLPVPTEGSPK